MIILNPVPGSTIRNDQAGAGFFHARRRNSKKEHYLHKGVDLTLPQGTGQDVVSPISGKVRRISTVYSTKPFFSGIVIENPDICVKLFYMKPIKNSLPWFVNQGEIIGFAEDISERYTGASPHIHLEVSWVSPLLLM